MHHRTVYLFAIVLVALTLTRAQATSLTLDRWFLDATRFYQTVNGAAIAKPDFLGGTSMRDQCKWLNGNVTQLLHGIWQLQKYDRAHRIGLAVATTDQCTAAIFRAAPPPPPATAPDADLSNYGTGRGLRIGSPYSQVLRLYGPPEKHGQHFVIAYTANVPDVAMNGKPVKLPEVIKVVVDNGSVSAITVYIDAAGLY